MINTPLSPPPPPPHTTLTASLPKTLKKKCYLRDYYHNSRVFYLGLSSVGPNTIARLLPGIAFASSCSETRLRCIITRAAVTRFAVGSCITTSRSLPMSLSYSSRISSFSEASLHVVELLIRAKLSCRKLIKTRQSVMTIFRKTNKIKL